MKRYKLIVLFVLVMLQISCSGKENANPDSMSKQELEDLVTNTTQDLLPVMSSEDNQNRLKKSTDWEHKSVNHYDMKTLDEMLTGIKSPAGLLCRENDILVIDQKNNALVKLDYSFQSEEIIGKLGGDELEFQTPTGISRKENNIYILDSNNRRIQVLSENLSFVKEIKEIERNTFDGTDFQSVASDHNGNIYMAGNILMERKIVWKDSEGELKSTLDNFYGTVYGTEDEAYALNRGQVFTEPEKKTIGIGYGKNILFSLNNGEAEKIAELPENLGVLTFCVKEDKIYVVSHSQQAVMIFNFDGEYIETAGKLQDMDNKEQEFYMDVDMDGKIYVARTEKNRIDVFST